MKGGVEKGEGAGNEEKWRGRTFFSTYGMFWSRVSDCVGMESQWRSRIPGVCANVSASRNTCWGVDGCKMRGRCQSLIVNSIIGLRLQTFNGYF